MKKIYLFFCLILSLPLAAQWSTNPASNNVVHNSNTNEDEHVAVSDGAGGLISIFFSRTTNGTDLVTAQRLAAANGALLWGTTTSAANVSAETGNKSSLTAIPDGAGGAFIAWADNRFSSDYSEVYIQRINSSGNPQWVLGGVRVTNSATTDDNEMHLCPDGAGGVFVIWNWDNQTSNIQSSAQRYNSTGVPQWAAGGVQVCNAAGFRAVTSAVSDGAGGAIVFFADTRNDPHGTDYQYIDTNSTDNLDVFAQRISAAGSFVWASTGVAINTAAENQIGINATLSDGSGGALVVMRDLRNFNGNYDNEDIYVQKVNSNGIVQWALNGVPVIVAPDLQNAEAAIMQDNGSLLVTWQQDSINSTKVFAQSISTTGTQQWVANGLRLSNPYTYAGSSVVCSDGAGNTVCAFEVANNSFPGPFYILAQKIKPDGSLEWGSAGRLLSTTNNPYDAKIVTGTVGTAIVSFRKNIAVTGEDLFAMKTDGGGTCTLPVQPSVLPNNTQCAAAQVSYTVTAVTGATGYTWTLPTGWTVVAGQGTATITLTVPPITTSTNYTLSVAATNSCGTGTPSTFTVAVQPTPPAPVITPTSAAFCTGGSVVLTASAATTYQWYKDGIVITNATVASYTVTMAGTYTVFTTAGGCRSAASNAVVVTVNTIPPLPTITQNGNVLTSSSVSGNQWYKDGVLITGATAQSYTPTAAGIYTVQATVNNCPSSVSAGLNFVFTALPNVTVLGDDVKIFPNPVQDKLTILRPASNGVWAYRLVNANGKTVAAFGNNSVRCDVDMKHYAAGPYILIIVDKANKRVGQKMILKL